MQKSMELMQRRNRRQNAIIAEQTRAIAKLYSTISDLIKAWDRPSRCTIGWTEFCDNKIAEARKVLKEIKL